jgi:hypothetical protein
MFNDRVPFGDLSVSTLVVTQLQLNCNSNSYNLVVQASRSLVRPRPKLLIYLT